MNYQPLYITGYKSGLQKNRKPFAIMEDAFQILENAYVRRERVIKREGLKLLGRLTRIITEDSIGNSGASPWTISTLYSNYSTPIVPEANAEIEPGSVTITIQDGGGDIVFTDSAKDGILSSVTAGNSGYIDYTNGTAVLTHTAGAGVATVAQWRYFPNLPVMGILLRELSGLNVEATVIFDTVYYYTYNSSFETFTTTATYLWTGDDSNFFWGANYRGSDASSRAFFVTNFVSPSVTSNFIRYTEDGTVWTDLTPFTDVANTTKIYTCKIIVAYYGRLVFLNTWEGTTPGGAKNYYNRCRFSQIGNPVAADAWLSDEFGKGGFIDAPTNEQIVSARFYKNTLIVSFEKSTWILRYVGEYGLPFIWERISSDFGSESTFSTVLFDEGVLAVGDKAIVVSSGNDVQRIDLMIPDNVFNFRNDNSGTLRVQGAREFRKELVYWSFVDASEGLTYPNKVLIFNYRDPSFAVFRDSTTALGPFQVVKGVSWDSYISWDGKTSWDTDLNTEEPVVISGNQQGFIHYYQYKTDVEVSQDRQIDFKESESLTITDVTRSATDSIIIESTNHNLKNGELIYIAGLNFVNTSNNTALTNTIDENFYEVQIIDEDTFYIFKWNVSQQIYLSTEHDIFAYTPAPGTGTYVGGGVAALLPKMKITTKDFSPYGDKGVKFKSAYTSFFVDATPNSEVLVKIYVDSLISENEAVNTTFYNPLLNTSTNQLGSITNITQATNAVISSTNHGLQTGRSLSFSHVNGMTEINGLNTVITVIDKGSFSCDDIDSSAFTAYTSEGYWQTNDKNTFYVSGSAYSWHRVYSNAHGQFLTFEITYDDTLMNSPITHTSDFEMNAMTLWVKEAGKMP